MKKHDRSWLTLVSFLIATTLASSLVFALAFAGVTAVIGESAQAADEPQVDPITTEQTFSGVITDARCGARHTNRGEERVGMLPVVRAPRFELHNRRRR